MKKNYAQNLQIKQFHAKNRSKSESKTNQTNEKKHTENFKAQQQFVPFVCSLCRICFIGDDFHVQCQVKPSIKQASKQINTFHLI